MDEQSYDDDYLAHYGVLGMKWGVRKDRDSNKTEKLTDRKVRKEIKKTAKARTKASLKRGVGSGTARKQIKAVVDKREQELPGFRKKVIERQNKVQTRKLTAAIFGIPATAFAIANADKIAAGAKATNYVAKNILFTTLVSVASKRQAASSTAQKGREFAEAMGINAPNVIDLASDAYKVVRHKGFDMVLNDYDDDYLAHYGVLGMKWGVRRPDGSDGTVTGVAGKGVPTNDKKTSYADKAYLETPGATKTSVTSKTGEVISIEKDRMGPLGVAFSKLTGKKPKDNISSMSIRNKDGKKIGSFQIWNDGPGVVRGEWLEIDKKNQGRGYSEAAISALIKGSKNNSSVKEIRLQVPSEAAAAKHIYNKVGFKKDKVLGHTNMYGDLEDWVYKL